MGIAAVQASLRSIVSARKLDRAERPLTSPEGALRWRTSKDDACQAFDLNADGFERSTGIADAGRAIRTARCDTDEDVALRPVALLNRLLEILNSHLEEIGSDGECLDVVRY